MTRASKSKSSIDEKLNIIRQYDEKIGVLNKQQIADELGLPFSPLRTMKYMWNWKNAFSESTKRHSVRIGKNEQLDNILLKWFRRVRTVILAVNGSILMEKANKIAKSLNITDFDGSNRYRYMI